MNLKTWSLLKKLLAVAGGFVVLLFIIGAIVGPSATPTPSASKEAKTDTQQQSVSVEEPTQPEVVAATSENNSEVPAPTPTSLSSTPASAQTPPTSPNAQTYKVVKVTDGDTIELSNGEKVRYIGIDTPETVHPSKSVQCFGKEASAKNTELVLNKEVRLDKDVTDRDKYGRLLRYVYVGDVFVNDYMVRQGYAYAYRYPPDVKFSNQFNQAQEEARSNQRGLWGANCSTVSPTPPPTADPAPASGHTFYLSSYKTAKYYYCDTDDGWKNLDPKYLKSYPSEAEALKAYPGRTLHEPCK